MCQKYNLFPNKKTRLLKKLKNPFPIHYLYKSIPDNCMEIVFRDIIRTLYHKTTRMKRYFLFLILAAVLFSVMSACKSKSRTSAANEDALFHDADMIERMTHFSLGFYRELSSQKKTENVSFSPASLNMAMAAVYSGSAGLTREEIASVFGFETDAGEFHSKYNEWLSAMLDMSTDTLAEFDFANRVFIEKTLPVTEQYIQDVKNWHAGAFETLDFVHSTRQAEAFINAWVEEMTRRRIVNLIPQGSLTPLTRLVLVNAMYIKSSWKYPFSKHRTRQKDFTTASGAASGKMFMQLQQKNIPYYEHDDFLAIELPYTTPDLSLLVIRPNQQNVPDISKYIPGGSAYKTIIEGLSPHEVRMEIPRFKIESEFSLGSHLKQAGVVKAFNNREADFSGIVPNQDLSVSEVFQKVFFEVDEEGSEAAAATGIVMVTTSMPAEEPVIKEFIADRPFLFILKENRFNTPLFIGQFVK
jgi:serpin B